MKKNIGPFDRSLRLIIALLLLGAATWFKSWILACASLFTFYESFAGWCIYYHFSGKSSCPLEPKTPSTNASFSQSIFLFLVCLSICLGVEALSTIFTQDSVHSWYPLLNKPWWTPHPLAFPIVWTILYTIMAVALWLVAKQPAADKKTAYIAFGCQLFFNLAWSFLFFYLHTPFYALIDIVLLLGAITATIGYFRPHSLTAALLLFPYLVWVVFAATLNLYILLNN